MAVSPDLKQKSSFCFRGLFRIFITERIQKLQKLCIPLPDLQGQDSLGWRGDHLFRLQIPGDPPLHSQTPEACRRQYDTIQLFFFHFTESGVHISPDVHDTQVRTQVFDLILSAPASCPDNGALQPFFFTQDQHISGILPLPCLRKHEPGRRTGRHILHAVHTDLHLAGQYFFLNFFHKYAFIADFMKRLI